MGEQGEVLERKNNHRIDWLMFLIIGNTILSAVAVKLLYGIAYAESIRTYGLTITLLLIVFTGVSISSWKEVFTHNRNLWTLTGYVCSLLLIVASVKYPIYNLWFLGSVLIGIMVNEYLGIAMQFILAYLYCGLNGYNMERMLFYFILGALVCLLGKYLYEASTAIYVMIIVLSCNIIFLFVMNGFIFQDSLSENGIYSVLSSFMVMLIIHAIMRLKGIKPSEVPEVEEEKVKPISMVQTEPKEVIYDTILNENYELLQQLKEKSPSLYAHSVKVAELAANGAAILGGNEKIAKAGGLYHEIGRLVSKDYIAEGVKLLGKYDFPKNVIDVVRQHNTKLEKPQSKEAAVVMLAESVVSTVTYLAREKQKALSEGKEFKEQPVDKVVENVFSIRFGKGLLDESGITVSEYNQLKKYYVDIYTK